MTNLGRLTFATVEKILCDLMREAIEEIRLQRLTFKTFEKENLYKKNVPDIFTSADQDAQNIYLKGIEEYFPEWGIIGEENELRKASQNGIWITLDPVDGTRAYSKKQSSGVGSMVAVFQEKQILMAYVGDVMTQDIYGFRADFPTGRLWLDFRRSYPLQYVEKNLNEGNILISMPLNQYEESLKKIIKNFKSYQTDWNSIGMRFSKLWSGEVSALLFNFKYFTPWDAFPVLGISEHLGYRLYIWEEEKQQLLPYTVPLKMEPYTLHQDILVIHESLYQRHFSL